jgi:hypothetical protein
MVTPAALDREKLFPVGTRTEQQRAMVDAEEQREYLKGRCEWTGDFVWAICPAVVSRLWDGANPIEDSRQRMMINNQQFVRPK